METETDLAPLPEDAPYTPERESWIAYKIRTEGPEPQFSSFDF